MSSWFSKVFDKKKSEERAEPVSEAPVEAAAAEPTPEPAKPREVLHAPILMDEGGAAEAKDGIAIKAKLEEAKDTVTFLFDRNLLEGHSCWCPNVTEANAASPLATVVFGAGGAETVLIHESTMTVTRDGTGRETLEEYARRVGQTIREALLADTAAVAESFLDSMPSEEEIQNELQAVIDNEINPGIASHSGEITLDRVVGNTAYITMGGGCQGCAASTITLKGGIETAFRAAVPTLGALLDQTDHESGDNPYFKELPAGMGV